MSIAAYTPPAPPPRIIPPRARPSLQGYWRYFRIMATNPLEIWSENHFNDLIHRDRIFGRDYALVHDPDTIRHFLVTNASNYGLTPIRKLLFEPIIGDGLLIAEGDQWRRTRRALTPVFTPRHVSGFADIMKTTASAAALEFRVRRTVKLSKEMLRLTLNILTATLFSNDDELDAEGFSNNLERLFEIAGMPHPFDLVTAPRWVPRIGRGEAMRVVRKLRAQVAAVSQSRRILLAGGGAPPADFLTLLLQAGVDEGMPLTDEEIVDNLLTFLAAGHETTARTLTWAFYLLSNAPEALARVEAEVDRLDLNNVAPQALDEELPFTTAALKETMRLYPAAPVLTRRALNADKLGGFDIKPDTEVVTSTWVLHRHRKLWRNPDVFEPNRFLGEDGARISRFAYLPFGAGPRVCIGASFAMQEMQIVLAAFLSKLRFSHIGAKEPEPVMRITIQPSNDVEMQVDKR